MPTEDAGPVDSSASGQSRILIVIPTLGQRLDYLRQTIASVSEQSVSADVIVVLPRSAEEARSIAADSGAAIIDDPGGQSAAINLGMSLAEARHEFHQAFCRISSRLDEILSIALAKTNH